MMVAQEGRDEGGWLGFYRGGRGRIRNVEVITRQDHLTFGHCP